MRPLPQNMFKCIHQILTYNLQQLPEICFKTFHEICQANANIEDFVIIVDCMANHIYPSELQLNEANVSDTETSFADLHLSISDGFVKTKIFDKRDDFDFDIVYFPFLDGLLTSYGVYVSQLIRFARVSSHVDDFNIRNKVLTAKLLRQGYRYHKIRKAF